VSSQDTAAGEPRSDETGQAAEPPSFDTTIAHPARVYDYLMGGKDNYDADREAAEEMIAFNPAVQPTVRANRAFLRRAVQYLAGEAGIRQFLDIGTGLPTAENTHEVAQAIARESRVVYVDNDPIVLAHARALLDSTPEGATAYVDADVRDPGKIIDAAARTLDFRQPVAVMMLAIIHFIPDSDGPRQMVSRLMEAVPPGSFLAISSVTTDLAPEEMSAGSEAYNARLGPNQFVPRTRAETVGFFDGLELVEPGFVPVPQWRGRADPSEELIPAYAGLGRKG
jgi:hypothetical protein